MAPTDPDESRRRMAMLALVAAIVWTLFLVSLGIFALTAAIYGGQNPECKKVFCVDR